MVHNQCMHKLMFSFVFSFLFCQISFAAPAVLEFPNGRFLDTNSPTFFKWTLNENVSTLAIKLYRLADNSEDILNSNLVTRTDVTSDRRSISLPRSALEKGRYAWVLEGYNETNPLPIFSETAQFEIETAKVTDVRTHRFSLFAGFGRGQYVSQDSNYDLSFDTTPNIFGFDLNSGGPRDLWNNSALMSDFIVRGKVRRNYSVASEKLWKVGQGNPLILESFLGPSLRYNKFSRVQSPDGTNLSSDSASAVNVGLTGIIQRQLAYQISTYARINLDLPAYSPEGLTPSLDQLNYSGRLGFLYGVLWPLGFAFELQYKSDRTITKKNSDEVDVRASSWTALISMYYSL